MPELMTKQDAIEYLLYIKQYVQEKSLVDTALDTAIEALKQPTIDPEVRLIPKEVSATDLDKMTNYEKIKSMSESQLAKYLDGIGGCRACPKFESGTCTEFHRWTECIQSIESWLKEETTDDD